MIGPIAKTFENIPFDLCSTTQTSIDAMNTHPKQIQYYEAIKWCAIVQ